MADTPREKLTIIKDLERMREYAFPHTDLCALGRHLYATGISIEQLLNTPATVHSDRQLRATEEKLEKVGRLAESARDCLKTVAAIAAMKDVAPQLLNLDQATATERGQISKAMDELTKAVDIADLLPF